MDSRPVPLAAVEAQLGRVLASATFRGAERSRALLRFVVEETLQGRADRLKDYTLGSEALGRGEGFDPRIDPIARVEASRLRSRLDAYYATEGIADEVRIWLPKGRYVPVFEARPEPAATPDGVPAVLESAVAPGRVVLPAWRSPASLLSAAVAVALLGATGGWFLARSASTSPASPELRLEIVTAPTTDPASVAIAPDGQSVVFVATADGLSRLWVRRLDAADPRPLPGTEYASLPFWAPDGHAVGFFADGRIKALDLRTGVVRVLSTAPVPAGAAWNAGGVILHPLVPDSPLFRTTAIGSPLAAATELAPGQTGHRGPVFLPDGRRFVFYASGSPAVRGIYVGELGTTRTTRILDADTPAVVAAPDHLLYVQHATLFAHRFDPVTAAPVGEPIAIARDVGAGVGSALPGISASRTGTITYRRGAVAAVRQFIWVDRHGKELSRIGTPEARGPAYGSLSPDGRRMAIQRATEGNTDIWLLDLERATSIRVTSDQQADIAPVWSPDGRRVAFASQIEGIFQLFERPVNGGAATLLTRTPHATQMTDWSRDGRYVLYRAVTMAAGWDMDIWAMALEGDRTPFPVVRTAFEERDAQFSPDGNWIAYQSNESGEHEIYVQPFRRTGERLRISSNGGLQARWRRDGRELFYLTLDSRLVAVPTVLEAGGRSIRVGTPTPLLRASVGAVQGIALHSYVIAADGERFLLDAVLEQQAAPVSLILNWKR